MKIVLINAAAPDYSRKKRYSPSAFAEASVAFAATELKKELYQRQSLMATTSGMPHLSTPDRPQIC